MKTETYTIITEIRADRPLRATDQVTTTSQMIASAAERSHAKVARLGSIGGTIGGFAAGYLLEKWIDHNWGKNVEDLFTQYDQKAQEVWQGISDWGKDHSLGRGDSVEADFDHNDVSNIC